MECAVCHEEIKEEYLTVTENHIQRDFFEELDGSDNIFCSDACLYSALMIESKLVAWERG